MSTQTDPQGFWRVRYTVLSILLAGWLFSFLDRMIMGVALPYIGEEFGLNNEQRGLIMSAFFLGYALCQIPGGMLADKYGPRKVMSYAITWWSVFTSATGMVFSLPLMLVVRCVFGVGEAGFPAASWKTIATYFPSRQRATATAIQSSVNALGPAIATVAAATILKMFGWRAVFIALGIPGVFIAAAMFLYIRNNPKDHPGMSAMELAELDADPGVSAAQVTGTTRKITFGDLLKMPILWQMVAIWFFFDITYWGFVSWLPSYLLKGRGFTLDQLAGYGSLPFFVGTVGLILGGIYSDKLKARGVHRKWLFIPTSLVAAVFLYVTQVVPGLGQTIAAQCVAAFFMFVAFAAFWGLVVDAFPTEIMGSGSATVNFGGQMAGMVAGWAVGKLVDLRGGGYDWAFWFLIAGTLAATLVAFTIRDSGKKA